MPTPNDRPARQPRSTRRRAAPRRALAISLLVAVASAPGGGPLRPAVGAEPTPEYSVTDLGAGRPIALAASGRVVFDDRQHATQTAHDSYVADPPATPGGAWTRTRIAPPDGRADPYDFVRAVDMNADGVVIGETIDGPFRWTNGVREQLAFLGPAAPATGTGCDGSSPVPARFLEDPTEPGTQYYTDGTYLDPSALQLIGHDGELVGRSAYLLWNFDTAVCPAPGELPAGATAEETDAHAVLVSAWLAKVSAWISHTATWTARSYPFIGSPTVAIDPTLTDSDSYSLADLGEGGHLVGLRDGRPYRFGGGADTAAFLDAPPATFEQYEVSAVNRAGTVAGAFTPASGADRAAIWSPGGVRTDLPTTDASLDARALGLNDQDEVVGEISEFMVLERNAFAALWDEDGVHDLNTLVRTTTTRIDDGSEYSFRLQKAWAVNDAGQILCTALVLPGEIERRVVVLTPLCETFAVTPLVLDFGDVEVGRSTTAEAVLTNCSDSALSIRAGRVSAPFRLAGAARRKLKAATATALPFSFRPDAAGPFQTDVTFSGPDGLRSQIRLVGRGVAPGPQLLVLPSPMDFGFAVRGIDRYPLLIQNLRDEPVRVTFGELATPFTNAGPRSITIAARATARREITFAPQNEGEATATLTLTTDVRGAPVQSVSFTGRLAKTVRIKRILRGTPEVRKLPGDWSDASESSVIDEGTEIATDPDTEVEIEYPDGSTTILRPSSQIKVLALFTTGGVVRTEIELAAGAIAARVQKSEVIRSDFKVRAPSSVASVRGTEFDVIHDEAAGATTVRVTEGVVEVDPVADGLRTVKVKAGRQVTVTMTSVGRITRNP